MDATALWVDATAAVVCCLVTVALAAWGTRHVAARTWVSGGNGIAALLTVPDARALSSPALGWLALAVSAATAVSAVEGTWSVMRKLSR